MSVAAACFEDTFHSVLQSGTVGSVESCSVDGCCCWTVPEIGTYVFFSPISLRLFSKPITLFNKVAKSGKVWL
jgi:hypothetical protein